jgi:hypothetical protein
MKSKKGFAIKTLVNKNKVYKPSEDGHLTLREMGIDNGSKAVCVMRFIGG